MDCVGDLEMSACMGSDAEPEAMGGCVIYGHRRMTVGGLAAEYGCTDLDGSQPHAWRYLVETDVSVDVADHR
jgi:hypothetical protein